MTEGDRAEFTAVGIAEKPVPEERMPEHTEAGGRTGSLDSSRLADLEKLCEEALYEEVESRPDGRSIVRDQASGRLFYRKQLETYNPEVFAWLKGHKSRFVPRIEAFWQVGADLVVIEELIQGNTLEHILEEAEQGVPGGELPFSERIRILLELCDGLAFLHGAQPPIIHRDLKPANIMITDDGLVKIIDYDAAKLYVSGQKRDTQLIGTQGTAAPEQYGFAASDARTDIYAMGKLLERMLPGNTDAARIAAKAAHMDPARRYSSAAQLREAIRRIREKTTGLDSLLSIFPSYNPASRMHRAAARGGILAALVLLVGLGFFGYQKAVVEPREQRAALEATLQSLSAEESTPDERSWGSRALLAQWPYDTMTSDQQKQFRDIARTLITFWSSDFQGEQLDTEEYLQDEGIEYLAAIRELGVDEKTVDSILYGGQIQWFLNNKRIEDAYRSVTLLEGLPDEEEFRQMVETYWKENAYRYTQSFRERHLPGTVREGLAYYTRMKEAGCEEAGGLYEELYEMAVTQADAQRDDGEYSDARDIYRILQQYEDTAQVLAAGPTLEERIQLTDYLDAVALMENGKYSKALTAFEALGDYRDSSDLAVECSYQTALNSIAEENYEKGIQTLENLSGYKEADEKCLDAKYSLCSKVANNPTNAAYEYIEDLVRAGYTGAEALREKMYTWHAKIETGVNMIIGAQQVAGIRATLSGGPKGGSTYIRIEVIDKATGISHQLTSEKKLGRGESAECSYNIYSTTEDLFEKQFTINIYTDDGTRIGTWSGKFSKDFLP